MRNGNSSLIPSMKANTLASLVYLFTAVFGILNGFWGFLALVTFVCAVVLIFIEKNSFVRRACVQVIFLHIVTFVSSLIFGILLGKFGFFRTVHWIICTIVALFTLYCSYRAAMGNRSDIPFIGNIVDSVCSSWAYNLPRALFTGGADGLHGVMFFCSANPQNNVFPA